VGLDDKQVEKLMWKSCQGMLLAASGWFTVNLRRCNSRRQQAAAEGESKTESGSKLPHSR
jgi:hypothetical protein